jgi:hypothetical protein
MKTLLFTLLTVLVIGTSNAQTKKTMSSTKPYTILVLMNATSKWLSLSREERSNFFESSITPIFQKVGKTTKVNLYDSEYFHSKTSDFMIINTTNFEDYKLLLELLRDTKIYGEPYFDIVDIIVGQENLFEDFNEKFKKEK